MQKQALQLLHYIQGMEQDKLAQWVSGGLLVLFSYSAAVTTWDLVGVFSTPQQAALQTSIPSQNKRARQSAPPPAALQLFGATGGSHSQAVDAPETNLNLSLTGVIASDDPAIARAFIAIAGGEEKSYAIGEQVSGNALVKEIYEDKVILSRNGRLETLRMPQKPELIYLEPEAPSRNKVPAAANQIKPRVSVQEVQSYKQKLLTAPNELNGLIRQRPVRRNGKIMGYRLFPGSDRELFNRLGLKPGDIITGVNGLPLTDPASAMELYGQLPTMSQMTIKLERQGQAMDLVLPWQ